MSIKVNDIVVIDNTRSANVTGLNVSGTSAIKFPVGTSAQRPSPEIGQCRYNTDIGRLEVYDGNNWGAAGAPSIHRYLYRNTNFIALHNDYVFADTENGSFTITLPIAPSTNDIIYIADYKGKFSKNPLTVNRNGKTILGTAQDMILDTNYVYMFFFIGNDWKVYTTGLSYVRGEDNARISLSGPANAFEGELVSYKIENYAIQGTYTSSTTGGNSNVSTGIVYWQLPSVDVPTIHTLTVSYELFGVVTQTTFDVNVVNINNEIDDSIIFSGSQFSTNESSTGWII